MAQLQQTHCRQRMIVFAGKRQRSLQQRDGLACFARADASHAQFGIDHRVGPTVLRARMTARTWSAIARSVDHAEQTGPISSARRSQRQHRATIDLDHADREQLAAAK